MAIFKKIIYVLMTIVFLLKMSIFGIHKKSN